MNNPTSTTSANSTSMTGRDSVIMGKALVYAIAHIQSLPEEQQEFSDLCDMALLARERYGVLVPACVLSVEWHSGRTPDLWPEGTPTERDRLLKPELDRAIAEKRGAIERFKHGSGQETA